MDRRPAPWIARRLLIATALVTGLVTVLLGAGPAQGATDPARDPAGETVITANPFLPEERDLTDCVGLVERPGCGSEERGGLHQNLVAIVMIGGLVLIFGRVAWAVRRSNRAATGDVDDDAVVSARDT